MQNEIKKQRVAVIFPEQVYPGKLGSTHLLINLAIALRSKGYEIKVFSLGREEREISEGEYEELVVASKVSSDSRTRFIKGLDYLSLATLGGQYSYYMMSNSKELEEALDEYSPDCIVTLGRVLTDFTIKYKSTHNVFCTTITDDFRVVDNALQIRLESSARKDNPLKRAVVGFGSNRFRSFSWRVYSRMVKGFDAIALLTDDDKKIAVSRFKSASGKFFVMPAAACPLESVLKKPVRKPGKKIKTVLFIGNARHEPNLQAMEIIEQKIAPRLKDKRFIIIGSGNGARSSGNVEYKGYVSDEEKLKMIDDADLCIAPLMKGSGIKVKMLDYFMRCKPVLATSLAFEGYGARNNVDGVVEDNADNYVAQIMRLERSPELRETLGINAGKLCAYFSYDNIGDKWDLLLTRLAKNGSNKK